MSDAPAPTEASRLLDLVAAYTQPRRADDLALPAATAAAPEASPKRRPAKSRRRHGSPKARRRAA